MSPRCTTLLLLLALSTPASALPVIGSRDELRFDRPEAWAMAYAASALLFSGTGPPDPAAEQQLQWGAELASIPRLSREQRRVGFHGSKLEDLNKTPVVGRLRARIKLPAELALELGWTPPLTINGATPRRMFGIALERPLWTHGNARGGIRLGHQAGRIHGDITCDRVTAAAAIGSADNPFGCRAPSRDRYTLRASGIELSAAWLPDGARYEPWVALSWHRLNAHTQVDAEVFGVRDRSLLLTTGSLATATLGLRLPPVAGWNARAALAWTPLSVQRPQRGRTRDDFWSLRLLLQR